MIAELEFFSGHRHIEPDQVGLARLFPVLTILCAQHLKRLPLPLLEIQTPHPSFRLF